MQIKILIGDKNNVDFGSSIEMNSEEHEKFIKLMESLFKPIEKEEISQFRSWRMSENERIQYPHAWTPAEYEVLLNSSSIEEAISKLGRSGMSIIIQSGVWTYKYYSWCEKMKKNIKDWNSIETIKTFLKENEDEILKRREERKKETTKKREERKEFEALKKEECKLLAELKMQKERIDSYRAGLSDEKEEDIEMAKELVKQKEKKLKEKLKYVD